MFNNIKTLGLRKTCEVYESSGNRLTANENLPRTEANENIAFKAIKIKSMLFLGLIKRMKSMLQGSKMSN